MIWRRPITSRDGPAWGEQRLLGCLVRKGKGETRHATYTTRTNDWLCGTVQSDADLALRAHKCSPFYSNAAWHPPSYSNAAWHRDMDTSDTRARTHTLNNATRRERERWRHSKNSGWRNRIRIHVDCDAASQAVVAAVPAHLRARPPPPLEPPLPGFVYLHGQGVADRHAAPVAARDAHVALGHVKALTSRSISAKNSM